MHHYDIVPSAMRLKTSYNVFFFLFLPQKENGSITSTYSTWTNPKGTTSILLNRMTQNTTKLWLYYIVNRSNYIRSSKYFLLTWYLKLVNGYSIFKTTCWIYGEKSIIVYINQYFPIFLVIYNVNKKKDAVIKYLQINDLITRRRNSDI